MNYDKYTKNYVKMEDDMEWDPYESRDYNHHLKMFQQAMMRISSARSKQYFTQESDAIDVA